MIRNMMTMTIRQICAALAALMLMTGIASAEDPKVLGRFKAWSAFTMSQGDEKVCFIVSDPKSKKLSRRGRNRGDVFFLVTHWPGESIYSQPSVLIGYPFGRNTTPTIRVGGSRFNMILDDANKDENRDRAWISDDASERRLIDSMKRGSNMIVTGRSASGTVSTDTYSLLGFTAALERIDKECK